MLFFAGRQPWSSTDSGHHPAASGHHPAAAGIGEEPAP
jgi:hypothetical protein